MTATTQGSAMKSKLLRWSNDFMYQAILNHAQKYDGKFLTCVKSTGIYCLPSCPARKPLLKNIRFLATEQEAIAEGFRICKRCRPDLFYRGESVDENLFIEMLARIRSCPSSFSRVSSLAKSGGISTTKLNELIRLHAHLSPADLLNRERIKAACSALTHSSQRILDVGLAVGFESEASFHRQFSAHMAMTPHAWRLLNSSSEFALKLPDDFTPDYAWRYHLRDKDSLSEHLDKTGFTKALWVNGYPVVIHLQIDGHTANCRWTLPEEFIANSEQPVGVEIHRQVMRLLGLNTDVLGFRSNARQNKHMARLIESTSAIYVPMTANPFESLVWAIIGQQINLTFAATLRQALIKLAGPVIGQDGFRIHPSAKEISELEPHQLTDIRFSRSKAQYLIGVAKAVVTGALDLDQLEQGSAVVAERKLCELKGIGPWTARYTLMRGMGFADCVPVGDSGLYAALQQFYQLDSRPSTAETEQLMKPFSPFRTQATTCLWESLRNKS
ncbi:DNA-3-methyladenine glycosylase 2 family protein [Limnobaculum parvum]|uniref:DNA-3-methyladenine glycosylase II n=1 Tax=Limnobaculum parvum TaxID=2172103 RepID=A0A2Y9U1P3_9GAMM|nr:Ada metal-binding domain-containing protein [Limnobaculum parvum]AWH89730.1 DNA-3-methyladenine glycosylase 2 family protein [Limnobaculum parvum]